MVRDTRREQFSLPLILLTHALTVSPLTSISQAPQLPVKHPLGISKPAFSAVKNQSSPSKAYVSILLDHKILIVGFINLILMKYLNVYQIHLKDY